MRTKFNIMIYAKVNYISVPNDKVSAYFLHIAMSLHNPGPMLSIFKYHLRKQTKAGPYLDTNINVPFQSFNSISSEQQNEVGNIHSDAWQSVGKQNIDYIIIYFHEYICISKDTLNRNFQQNRLQFHIAFNPSLKYLQINISMYYGQKDINLPLRRKFNYATLHFLYFKSLYELFVLVFTR